MLLQAAECSLPKLVYGFSTRHGGVSEGPYASLNLGRAWGDDPARVQQNYAALAQMGGFAPSDLVMVQQVHKAEVVRASEVDAQTQADGIFASIQDPGPKVVAVRTADCVPVLLASRDGERFAALHSGWRSTVANIVSQGVARLCQDAGPSMEPSQLCAMVGPCIERNAFEVGPEVAEQFPTEHRLRYGSGRWHVDLVGMVFAQLRAAGLDPEHCYRVGRCTHDHPQDFFSYRRDGKPNGQMVSFIGQPLGRP